MKLARWGLTILLVSPLVAAGVEAHQDQTSTSSDQDGSLAAASRRALEQKKEQAKTVKVWDNDTMPTAPGGVNVVGQESPSGSDTTPSSTPAVAGKPADVPAIQSNLDAAKQELESLKTDLDILQRKYTLDEQDYLRNPNHPSDKAGAAALEDEQNQISDKQQAIADAQKKIADLQARLDAAAASKTQ
jgi:hypothetical protein